MTLVITFLSVGLLFLTKMLDPEPGVLFEWPRLFVLVAISAAIFKLLTHFNWEIESGLTTSISSWPPKWPLASIPLLLIALLSLTAVDFTSLEFSPLRISAWLLANFATGFFEEILMRGLCFFILLKAWGSNKKGVFLAAVFQAFVFGIAHVGNLYNTPILDVFAQVVFATLIGIGFAGLVYLTKSLWPAIIIHTVINSTGSINSYLVPQVAEFQSPGLAGYVVIIAIFFVLSTIPGLLYLKSGQPNLAKTTG